MSHTFNPYSGVWNSGSHWPTSAHSPTYGALPQSPTVASPDMVTYHFTSAGPTNNPLASTVVDSNNFTYFTIWTQVVNGINVTNFATAADRTMFASVEWANPAPYVYIANRLPRQDATRWLMFSHDRRTATMGVGPDLFVWTFHGNSIKLYKRLGNGNSERLGKLYFNTRTNSLCLDLHVSLLQVPGNLEIFIVAGALLQSKVDA